MLGLGQAGHLDDRRRRGRRGRRGRSSWRNRNYRGCRGGRRHRFARRRRRGRSRRGRRCRWRDDRRGRRRGGCDQRLGGASRRRSGCGDGSHCGGRTLDLNDRRLRNIDRNRDGHWRRLRFGRVRDGTRASLLGGCLLRRLGRLFGLNVSLETFALGLAADAVSLGLFDARRLRLHANAELEAHIECLFVRETELFGELVNPDLACHLLGSTFRLRVAGATGGVQVCHVIAVLAE